VEKEHHCNCKTGCANNRCACLRNNEPCDEECGCVGCQNPLNGVDVMRGYSIGAADLGGRVMKDTHEIIDQLSPGDALAVLKALARKDDQLAVRIAEKATLYLSNVDPEEVAAVLCDGLDMLEVEEVWNWAGPKRHGYVDPGEAADEAV
jgi:hypothetical protein